MLNWASVVIVILWVAIASAIYFGAQLRWPALRSNFAVVLAGAILAPGYFGLDLIAPVPAVLGLLLWCMEGTWPLFELVFHAVSWIVVTILLLLIRNHSR